MADQIKCDHCTKFGPRRLRRMAPEGWFYIESLDQDNPKESWITYACSVECRDALWQVGPGPLMDLTETDTPIRAEVRARKLLQYLRADGWRVGVHNDYQLNGEFHTFWLMVRGEVALKGEGRSDDEALRIIVLRTLELSR